VARKDSKVWVKVAAGVIGVALVLALMSDGDPGDDDAWVDDESSASVDDSPFADGTGQTPSPAPDGADVDIDLDDDGGDVSSGTAEDDAWTRDAPADVDVDGDDADPEPPPDDPWTRGSPAAEDGGDDDDAPVDDPWSRGRRTSEGGGLPPCGGTMEYVTGEGRVQLPTDQGDDAFASADCALGPGRSGAAVSLVQAALNECNGQAVPVTGVNDEATSRALAAVQAHHGLAADGVYGPATREAMAWPTQPDDGGPVCCMSHPDIG
jgi:hypothetical protein